MRGHIGNIRLALHGKAVSPRGLATASLTHVLPNYDEEVRARWDSVYTDLVKGKDL